MRLSRLSSSEFRRTPWKNGLGHTDQIAIHPSTGDLRRGDYLWRASTARVAQSSPFSLFTEHDRVLVVLEGRGVRLSHTYEAGEPPEIVELPPLEPYDFPGDVPTRCDLLEGEIQDFSVFVRKGEVQAQTEIWSGDTGETRLWALGARTCLLFVARGSVRGGPHELGARDALRIDLDEAGELELRVLMPDTRCVLVLLDY